MIIDQLTFLYQRFMTTEMREPKYFILHPKDAWRLQNEFYGTEVKKDEMKVNGVKFIRSYDIPEGSPELV